MLADFEEEDPNRPIKRADMSDFGVQPEPNPLAQMKPQLTDADLLGTLNPPAPAFKPAPPAEWREAPPATPIPPGEEPKLMAVAPATEVMASQPALPTGNDVANAIKGVEDAAKAKLAGSQQTPASQAPVTLAPTAPKVDEPVPTQVERQPLPGEAENITAKGELEKKIAEEEAEHAAEKAAAAKEHAERVRKATEWGTAEVAKRQAQYDERKEAYLANNQIKDYWADKTLGTRVVAGLAVALGAFGAGMSAAGGYNTGNVAAAQLMQNIENDFRKQRENIANLKDSVAIAATGIQDAERAKSMWLQDINAKHEAALKALEAKGVEILKRNGKAAAEIDKNSLLLDMRKRAAAVNAENERNAKKDVLEEIKVRAQAERDLAAASLDRSLGHGTNDGGGGGIPDPASKAGKASNALAEAMRETSVTMPDGTTRYARNVKQAEEANRAMAVTGPLIKAVRDLRKMVGTGTVSSISDAARREATLRDIQMALKSDEQLRLGVLAGPDLGLLEDITGGKLATWLGLNGPKLELLERSINRRITPYVKSRLLSPEQQMDAEAQNPRALPTDRLKELLPHYADRPATQRAIQKIIDSRQRQLPKAAKPKVGEKKTFPNGKTGTWNGRGWEAR